MRKLAVTVLFLIVSLESYSQKPLFFRPEQNAPIYLNPGFSGRGNSPRLFSNFSSTGTASSLFTYSTRFLSYDQYIPKLSGGFAFSYIQDNALGKTSRSKTYNIAFSKDLVITDNFKIYPAVELGINNVKIKSLIPNSNLNSDNLAFNKSYLNTNLGVVFSHYSFSYGIVLNNVHLAKKNSQNPQWHQSKGFTAHMQFEKEINDVIKLYPSLVFYKEPSFQTLAPSLVVDIKQFKLGIGSFGRNKRLNPANYTIGYENKRFLITYNFFNIFNKTEYQTHQLSVRINFKSYQNEKGQNNNRLSP